MEAYLEKSCGMKDSPEVEKELTDRVNGVMGDDVDDEAAAAAPSEGGTGSDGGGVA